MSVELIRTGIKDKLEGITSVNKVLDYVIWTDDWKTIYNLFAEGKERINVWMVGLGASPLAVIGQGYKERVYTFNIFGYYSIKTSNQTSKTFENIIGDIVDDFDGSLKIATGAELQGPITIVSIVNTIYLQHPCHQVAMQVSVRDRVVDADGGLCDV